MQENDKLRLSHGSQTPTILRPDKTILVLATEQAIEQLFQSFEIQQSSLFTMLGHEVGVVSVDRNMPEAAWELIKYLSLSIGIKPQ